MNGRTLAWKQLSTSGFAAGQIRYWYPPPWLAAEVHATSTVSPARQIVPDGAGFRVKEPRSPTRAFVLFV
eukprot:SAG22_NODE_777_length_7287_cov_3.210519_3_plen_70_part_00